MRAKPSASRRQIQYFHSAVRGRRTTTHQPARFEPVHQTGHVRCVAGEGLGELPHRDRSAGLDEVQHVALRRRELELGGERRQVGTLREEELHQELPGIAACGRPVLHRGSIVHFINH